jgi:hypothetical protein
VKKAIQHFHIINSSSMPKLKSLLLQQIFVRISAWSSQILCQSLTNVLQIDVKTVNLKLASK